MPRKLTQEEVLTKFAAVWGGRWDYSEVEYKNSSTKITIICKDHGRFYQTPAHHLSKVVGCHGCTRSGSYEEEFTTQAAEVWEGRLWVDRIRFIKPRPSADT